jgi:hypothetical protein
VFARVEHGKNASFWEICESQVPFALHVLCSNLVDLLEGIEVCYTDLGWRESDDGTVLLVESVNVEYALASHDRTLQAKVGEACVPWPWKVPGRACETNIDKLSM